MPRVLLLVPTATYRAPDFVNAARDLGIELLVGTDEPPALGDRDRIVAIPCSEPELAADLIDQLDRERGVDAVVAVDDQGIVAAATAGERLGFPHNPPDAAAATRDKLELRTRLAGSEVLQPRFGSMPNEVGYPCVVKPTGLSGSRGVIRCNNDDEYFAARARIAAFWDGDIIVEEYVPGIEVAVEGILHQGALTVLAVFDKPDPLEGPYFEETIYVTPSRLPRATLDAIANTAERAARALGLEEGPIHAELRVEALADGQRIWVIEVAARSIGGLCARTLRFGTGISLEEMVLRHALGMPIDVAREAIASGVMMLPIPKAGMLDAVRGEAEARAVPGIVGFELTIPFGHRVKPLPEGDRYLGFLFARAASPAEVEAALRTAAQRIDIVIT